MTTAVTYPITLLNATYEPLNTNLSVKKAARLLALGKAVIEEANEELGYLDAAKRWVYPKVLKLTYYVKIAYDKVYGAKKVSKRGVLLRDEHTCAYCGGYATTVDHIIPKSKGGTNDWLNLVAACQPCNGKKRDRTPQEAKMQLLITPFESKRVFYR